MSAIRIILAALLALCLKPGPPTLAQNQSTNAGPLSRKLLLEPCRLPGWNEDVRCGKYEVYENRTKKVKTSELNEVMLDAIEAYPPPSIKGKFVKIKYVTQLPSQTPSFAFFANLPQYVKEPYRRYLENKIREKFNFSGVPVQIFIRKK